MTTDDAVLAWLLDSDPSLRWRVERDLADAPPSTWEATRARVPHEGFGARLLTLQGDDGTWAGGAFFPAGHDFAGSEGQPWTATTWSLNSLREWGVPASALAGTLERLDANARWEYDDLPFWDGEVDCCINSWTLQNALWLGLDASRTRALADWFVEHRMADGGWNCEWVEGSTRSSFPSTLNALQGLLAYERAGDDGGRVHDARRAGEEYLLERGLFRRLSTGEQVGPWTHQFAYPWRWFYNVLVALDHFREAAAHDGTAPDPRLADAVEIVRADREDDGRWLNARRHPGDVWFEVDAPGGEPSRGVTLTALRVLRWWDEAHAG